MLGKEERVSPLYNVPKPVIEILFIYQMARRKQYARKGYMKPVATPPPPVDYNSTSTDDSESEDT